MERFPGGPADAASVVMQPHALEPRDAALAWESGLSRLAALMRQGPFVVITGAGLSTGSGIPAYRDSEGQWQHPPPVQHQAFLRSEAVRRRYWARSFVGWRKMGQALPNEGHLALAGLQQSGMLKQLITQNVDGLHQKAGSEAVIELHGSIGWVRCLACGQAHDRVQMQAWLAERNPHFDLIGGAGDAAVRAAPDGDAHLDDDARQASFNVPPCPRCQGMLKPDVVFFGDNVPRERVAMAMDAVAQAAGLLVVGSSLMVYSGYRFAEQAHRLGKPIVAVNRGLTRADALICTKIDVDCGLALSRLVQALTP
jgi:NAD-dependent SIR2 family protein deacetylase